MVALKNDPGADILSSPTITTMSGRQAQIKIVDTLRTPDGQDLEIGQVVDVVPTVSEDGKSVYFSVVAKNNRLAK